MMAKRWPIPLTWKFQGTEILSSSLGNGGRSSEGGGLCVDLAFELRLANLKKPDFVFFKDFREL